MHQPDLKGNCLARCFFLLGLFILAFSQAQARAQEELRGIPVFNVKAFGATGKKSDNAHAASQKAVDACAAAGGGVVYLPPGEYTLGTIHLRSHVRFFIETGATLYSIKDKNAFDKDSLFYGEDLVNITLEGRGTVEPGTLGSVPRFYSNREEADGGICCPKQSYG